MRQCGLDCFHQPYNWVYMQSTVLVYIPTFVKVVELQSFSKAAKAMGMTKSAVSKQVQSLEDSLKVR